MTVYGEPLGTEKEKMPSAERVWVAGVPFENWSTSALPSNPVTDPLTFTSTMLQVMPTVRLPETDPEGAPEVKTHFCAGLVGSLMDKLYESPDAN